MPMVSALRAVLFYSTGVSAVRHIAILAFFIDDYLFGSIARNVAGTTRRRVLLSSKNPQCHRNRLTNS